MNRVKERVKALLFERRELSGEEAAKSLSVSRAAVWKAVEALRAEGLPVEAVRGLGYRLVRGSDVLCEAALQAELPQLPLRVLPLVDSTNLEAKRWALEGAPHGALVVAEKQQAGRGRMGRLFESPPGGLYMSVVLRPENGQAGLSLLTAAAAVAACRAVAGLCGRQLCIKWVNDLFWEGKKCCGILTEGVAGLESGGFEYLVCGIGINYTTPSAAFPAALQQQAVSIYPEGSAPVPRVRLAAEIHQNLMALFAALPRADFLDEYRKRNLVPGRRVQVMASPPYEALALGIDGEARLLVRRDDGEELALSAGEVSVLVET